MAREPARSSSAADDGQDAKCSSPNERIHRYCKGKARNGAQTDGGSNELHRDSIRLTFELTCGRQTAKRAGERQVERRVSQRAELHGRSAGNDGDLEARLPEARSMVLGSRRSHRTGVSDFLAAGKERFFGDAADAPGSADDDAGAANETPAASVAQTRRQRANR